MLSEAITVAVYLDDDRVMEKPIEQCGGDDAIAEDLAPLRESPVTGQDDRPLFVPGIDQLEEQMCATSLKRQIAHFVDNE